jgi:hypothetical protein
MKNVGGGPGDDDSGRRLPGKAVQTGSTKKRKRANREADIARAAAAEAVERGGSRGGLHRDKGSARDKAGSDRDSRAAADTASQAHMLSHSGAT